MRSARIFFKNQQAGILTEFDDGHCTFQYDDAWISDSSRSAISPTLPKGKGTYSFPFLPPVFSNMLPEGTNRQAVCQAFRLDPDDEFGILIHTAQYDTIGAITVAALAPQS